MIAIEVKHLGLPHILTVVVRLVQRHAPYERVSSSKSILMALKRIGCIITSTICYGYLLLFTLDSCHDMYMYLLSLYDIISGK